MNQTVGTIKQLNVVEITQKNILVQFRCHHTVFSSILNIDRQTTHKSIGWVLSISGSFFCMTGSSYLSGVKIVSSQQRVARRSLIPDSWVSTVHWAETKKKHTVAVTKNSNAQLLKQRSETSFTKHRRNFYRICQWNCVSPKFKRVHEPYSIHCILIICNKQKFELSRAKPP